MAKKHLKRITAPKTWNVKPKGSKFIMRPLPGMHTLEFGMPLRVILESINAAKTGKEIKYLLTNKQVLVDGTRRKEPKFMVGLLDVLSLPELKQHYRIVLNEHGYLTPVLIDAKEATLKLSKIIGKKMLRNNTLQLNLVDGRNILSTDAKQKDAYAVGDVLLLSVPAQKIEQHLRMEKGSIICLIGGKQKGVVGKVQEIKGSTVTFATKEGTFITPAEYTMVVGKDKPLITVTAGETHI